MLIRRFLTKRGCVALVFLSALLLASCDRSTAGGTTDGTSTIAFYLPDGKPAVRATVRVYASSDTGVLPRAQVFTDETGHASLSALPAGFYNLVVKDEGGRGTFQDSLVSDGMELPYKSDTLVEAGGVRGRVIVQPQHDPRIAWVALLGSGLSTNVDDSGYFVLPEVPEGRYTLVANATEKGYTPTFRVVVVRRDSSVTQGDIDLIYTGHPVVTGVTGAWNREKGTARISWDTSNKARVAGWNVLRASSDNPIEAKVVCFAPVDSTGWTDTIFKPLDADSVHLRYWVRAVMTSGDTGAIWYSWKLDAVGPAGVNALDPTWIQVGSSPCTGDCPMGELDSLLVMHVARSDLNGKLLRSMDGKTWTEIVSKVDSVQTDAPGKWTIGGFREGMFHKGRFWWVDLHGSTTSNGEDGIDTESKAESLSVHSIGADGKEIAGGVNAVWDSVDRVVLVEEGDSVVVYEGKSVQTAFFGEGLRIRRRSYIENDSSFKDVTASSPYDINTPTSGKFPWIGIDGLRQRVTGVDGRSWLVQTRGDDPMVPTETILTSVASGETWTLPIFVVQFKDAGGRILMLGQDVSKRVTSMYWALPETPGVWRKMSTPTLDATSKIALVGKRLWLLSDGVMYSTILP